MLLSPFVGLLILLCLKNEQKFLIRAVSVVAGGISLGLAIFTFVAYDKALGGLQFVEKYEWVKTFGITYFVGVEGLNAPMLLLTGIVIFTGCLTMWELEERTKEYFIWMMALVTGVFGVFMSYDMFFFFLFYEIAVVPMYILILVWGSTRKEYAAMKLTLYLMAGSGLIIPGILLLYASSGLNTFNMVLLHGAHFTPWVQKVAFILLFFGFGVLAAVWPLHTWSPDGHVAAPTAVSMLHAGVLLKLGAYGVFRLSMPIYPEGWAYWAFPIAIIGAVNVVYGALCAMNQTDLKYVIGYSSVSHMGYVLLGIGVGGMYALTGAVFQMFAHGIMTALFFALVGYVYETTHTRQIAELTGLMRVMPLVSAAFVIAGAASLGLPSTAGFVAELLVYVGLIKTYPLLAAVAFVGVAVTATYVLRMLSRILLGEPQPSYADATDPTFIGRIPILLLATTIMLAGLFPASLIETIQSGLKPLLARLGGG